MDNNTLGNAGFDGATPAPAPTPEPTPAVPATSPAPVTPEPNAPVAPEPNAPVAPEPNAAPGQAAPITTPTQDVPTAIGDNASGGVDPHYDKVTGSLMIYVASSVIYALNCLTSIQGNIDKKTCDALDYVHAGSCNDFSSFITLGNVFSFVLALVNIGAVITIMTRKKIGKIIAIAALAIDAIGTLVLTLISKGILDPFTKIPIIGSTIESTMTKLNANVVVTIVFSIGWIIYFVISKRVKNTLTK